MMSEKERTTSSSSPSRNQQSDNGGHSAKANSSEQNKGKGYSSRRKGSKRLLSQEAIEKKYETQPPFLAKDPKTTADAHEDEFFGNRKDYKMMDGGGFDGYYREPMDGGTKWGYQKKKQYQEPASQNGVLSMHQPGWKNQIENNGTDNGLTIRQQSNLSQSLRWDSYQQQTISRHEQGQDPAHAWQNFVDDFSRGKKEYQEKKRRTRRRQRNPE